MPRSKRLVVPNTPHHLTQRGNRKETVFFGDDDRERYLEDLNRYAKHYDVALLAYCLMDNHVHLIMVPGDESGLHYCMKALNTRHAMRTNRRNGWTGHLWQNRFFSCVLDLDHFYSAVRYTELNPVRAKMVEKAESYVWSSTRERLGLNGGKNYLDSVDNSWSCKLQRIGNWRSWLLSVNQAQVIDIRKATEQNRAAGRKKFQNSLCEKYQTATIPRRQGRPKVDK